MCISTASKDCCGFLRFYRWAYRVPCIRIYRCVLQNEVSVRTISQNSSIRWSRGGRTEMKEPVPRRPDTDPMGKVRRLGSKGSKTLRV